MTLRTVFLAATMLLAGLGQPTRAQIAQPTVIGGGSGASGGSSSATPATVSHAVGAATAVTAGGTAINAATAGTIQAGFVLKNPIAATEPLFFSLTGAAATTEGGGTFGLPAGASFSSSAATAQALSVNAATSGHAFSLQVTAATSGTLTPVTYAAGAASAVSTGGTAITAATAGTIHTGFNLKNPAMATEPLFFNLAGPAGTTEGGSTFALPPGGAYSEGAGTAQALSVNAATSGHTFSLQVF